MKCLEVGFLSSSWNEKLVCLEVLNFILGDKGQDICGGYSTYVPHFIVLGLTIKGNMKIFNIKIILFPEINKVMHLY